MLSARTLWLPVTAAGVAISPGIGVMRNQVSLADACVVAPESVEQDGQVAIWGHATDEHLKPGDTLRFAASGQRRIRSIDQRGDIFHVTVDGPLNPVEDGAPHVVIRPPM